MDEFHVDTVSTTTSRKQIIRPSKIVRIKDVDFFLYTTGDLAKRVKRAQETIRRWRCWKWVPRPIISTKDPFCWYLATEIAVYQDALDRFAVRRGNSINNGFIPFLDEEVRSLKKRISDCLNEGKDPHKEKIIVPYLKYE